ncbi:MAG: type IV pilus modification PilV family protein [Coriobacteriia bacterium]
MRGIWRKLSADEGMSLVEVIAAAAILFIVLTGVLSVVTQSTLMNAQAKRMNVANNAVNSYVEWVRSLPFAAVELSSVNPTGSLEPTSFANSGYQISIIPSVTVSALDTYKDPDLKELTLRVRVTSAGGYDHSYTTTVLIRNRDQYLVGGRRSAATDAQISLDVSPTPAAGSVVWGNAVPIAVTVNASAERVIETAALWVDNLRPMRSWDTSIAAWDIGLQSWTLNGFQWDTTYLSGTEPDVPDGLRTVVVRVRDSEDIEVYASRQFIVDNVLPPAPQPATHAGSGSMMGQLSWPMVYDGTTATSRYEVQMLEQGTSVATGEPFDSLDAVGKWRFVGTYEGSLPVFNVGVVTAAYSAATSTTAVPPFSRIFARARSLGARHLYPGWDAAWASDWTNMAVPFVTRPLLSGSYEVTLKNGVFDSIKPTISVTPPTFPLAAGTHVTYEWHRVEYTASGSYDRLLGSTVDVPTWMPTTFTNIVTASTQIGYYARVTCTPSGYMGGTPGTWTSNIALTPSLLIGQPLAVGTW